MKSIGTFTEPAKEINIYGKYDVVVVGGGVAGFSAAVAGARGGAKTLIIERFPYFGGTATASLMGNLVGFRNQVPPEGLQTAKGIAQELMLTLIAAGGAIKSTNSYPSAEHSNTKDDLSYNYAIDGELFKFHTLRMIRQAGCDILFHTYFCDVVKKDGILEGIIIENKSGRQLVRAEVFIDASGDGDVAFRCGVPFWQTKADENPRLPDCLMYKVEGFPEDTKAQGCIFGKQMIQWGNDCPPGNAADADELTEAEIHARLAVYGNLEEKRRNEPENYGNARVSDTGSLLGIRQTRFFTGEYVMTGEDVLAGARFDDGIAMASNPVIGYYGYRRFLEHEGYQIPYRALIPKTMENLYVVGRCMSSDQIAYESWRAMPPVMCVGEAAGAAAAFCVKDGVVTRKVDVKKLQEYLIAAGCELGQNTTVRGK